MDWARRLATGLAQRAIWSTLLSLVPFVSLWANLKGGSLTEMSQSTLRRKWTSSLASAESEWLNRNLRFWPGLPLAFASANCCWVLESLPDQQQRRETQGLKALARLCLSGSLARILAEAWSLLLHSQQQRRDQCL